MQTTEPECEACWARIVCSNEISYLDPSCQEYQEFMEKKIDNLTMILGGYEDSNEKERIT